MSIQTAPVSDHARRTARRVAALLSQADALLITAGAGMSLDCSPPDDPGLQQTAPHDGYRLLRSWTRAMPCGSFVVTSNVDGQFHRAGFTDWQVVERHGSVHRHQCTTPCGGAFARPNVLMYDDVTWLDTVRCEQQRRFEAWLASVRGKRIVVVECGAGEGAASVRRVGERLLERSRVSLVRINPTATNADEPTFVLRMPASQAIALIHESLPDLFGGANAARARPLPPALQPITGTVHLALEPVTCVDMGRGLVTPFDGGKFGQDEDVAFLERYAEAQTGWVQVPPSGGLEAPGYTMTARVIGSPEYVAGATPGAAIVFVQAPDGKAVMTFGIGRRIGDASFLWQLLYETADAPLAALDFPRVPWVARRPAAGLADHSAVLPYLARFERILVRSYLPYLTFIDSAKGKGGGGS